MFPLRISDTITKDHSYNYYFRILNEVEWKREKNYYKPNKFEPYSMLRLMKEISSLLSPIVACNLAMTTKDSLDIKNVDIERFDKGDYLPKNEVKEGSIMLILSPEENVIMLIDGERYTFKNSDVCIFEKCNYGVSKVKSQCILIHILVNMK